MPQVVLFSRYPNNFPVLYIHSFSSSENSTFFSYGITYYLVLNSKNNKKERKWLKLKHQKLPSISSIFGKTDRFCLIFNQFVLNENSPENLLLLWLKIRGRLKTEHLGFS